MAVAKAEAFEIADVDFIPEKKDHVGHQLQERNRARLTDIHQKKFNKESLAVEEETTGFFTQNFKKECDAILTLLECSGVDANDRLALSEHFDSVSVRWQRLQKFFNDSVALLPAFESRKARAQLESLQQRIAQRRNALMPKKKFAFKSKLKKTENVQTNGTLKLACFGQVFDLLMRRVMLSLLDMRPRRLSRVLLSYIFDMLFICLVIDTINIQFLSTNVHAKNTNALCYMSLPLALTAKRFVVI